MTFPFRVKSVHDQAESRVHRISQQYPVKVYYIIARNSVEEIIYRKQQERGQEEKEVIEEKYDTKTLGTESIKWMLGLQ
jgi:SNF2 family DNA or RNA helicase